MPCSDLSVVGIRPPDAKWRKMKAAYDACEAAGARVPDEVWEFFDHQPPDADGVVVELEREGEGLPCGRRVTKGSKPAVTDFDKVDMTDGVEIHLDRLPKDVTVIRVTISY